MHVTTFIGYLTRIPYKPEKASTIVIQHLFTIFDLVFDRGEAARLFTPMIPNDTPMKPNDTSMVPNDTPMIPNYTSTISKIKPHIINDEKYL